MEVFGVEVGVTEELTVPFREGMVVEILLDLLVLVLIDELGLIDGMVLPEPFVFPEPLMDPLADPLLLF